MDGWMDGWKERNIWTEEVSKCSKHTKAVIYNIYIETEFDEIIYLPIRSSHYCQYHFVAAKLLTLHKCHEETSNNVIPGTNSTKITKKQAILLFPGNNNSSK
jgi:hypothetical protein